MDLAKWLKKGKKQIQGVVAQVIPGGENYKSVVNNKPVNRPAPTYGPQQAPQQQFNQTPSFNKPPSINQNGRNRIGGIDIQAPTISKPEANKVDEVIRKQQRQSIQDLTDKFNRGEINKQQRQAAASATLTNDKTRAKPEAILRPKGIADNAVAVGMNLSRGNPITALQKAGKYADTLTNDTAIAPLGDLTNFLARKPAQIANLATGRDANSDFAKLEDSFADTNKMDSRIAKEAGNFAGMLGQTANFATAATAPIAFAGTVGDTGQQNFDELKAQGLSDNAAKGRSLASGVSQALIEKYSSKLQLKLGLEKMVAGSLVKGLVLEGGTEGLEEVTQKMVDNVATNKPMFEGVKEAATEGIKGGLMLGGTFGVVNHYGGNDTQAQPDVSVQQGQPTNQQQTTPEIQQQLQSPDPVVQQSAHDKLAGQTLPKVTEMPTAQGMVQRMRAAKQNVQKFNADLGQGGFIAGPLAGDFSNQQQQGKVFEGVDGKPRFEVDDSGAKIKNPEGRTLGEVLDHPQLFKNYPELKDVKVARMSKSEAGARMANGSYNPDTKVLTLAPGLTGNKLKGTILHEISHKIDDIEGRGGGTSPEFVTQESRKRAAGIKKEIEAVGKSPIMKRFKKDSERLQGDLDGSIRLVNEYKKNPEYVKASDRLRDLNDKLRAEEDVANNPMPSYERNLSEAEARAVEARMDMTDGERYAKPEMLDSLNPTGGLMVDYDPQSRVSTNLAENMTTLDKTLGGSPDDKITIYRGVDNEYNQSSINPGDFITDMPELAQSYTGDGNIIEMEVRKGDVIDDANEPGGNEYIYRPNADKESRSSAKPQSTFYDSLDVPKEDLIIRDGKGKAMSVEPSTPTPQTPKAQGVEEDFVPTAGLSRKQKQLISEISKLEKKLGSQDGMPGTYITGRNGVSAKRVARQNASLERTIDDSKRLIDAQSELRRVNDSIERQRRQSLKPKKEKRATVVSDASKIRVSESDSLRLYDYGFGGDKKQQLAKYIDHLNKGGEPKQGLERINAQYMSVSKNQPGVHDSLADNLPNQTGNTPIITKSSPKPTLQDAPDTTPKVEAPKSAPIEETPPSKPTLQTGLEGKAMSVEPNAPTAKTDPQASLEQEAKKYKTAEEFVKEIGNKLYSLNKEAKSYGRKAVIGRYNVFSPEIQQKLYSIKDKIVSSLGEDTGKIHRFREGGSGRLYKIGDQTFHKFTWDDMQSDPEFTSKFNSVRSSASAEISRMVGGSKINLLRDGLEFKKIWYGPGKLTDDMADAGIPSEFEKLKKMFVNGEGEYKKLPASFRGVDGLKYGYAPKAIREIDHFLTKKNFSESTKSVLSSLKDKIESAVEADALMVEKVNKVIEKANADLKSNFGLDYLDVPRLAEEQRRGISDTDIKLLENISEQVKTRSQLTDIYNRAHGITKPPRPVTGMMAGSSRVTVVDDDTLMAEAKKYKTAEEFVEAARSIENFDPAEAKTIFKDVKTGDGEAGVVKALTEFYNKANPSTETNITDPKLADNKIDTDDLKTERPQAYKMIDELSRELRDIDSANGVELIEPSVDAAYSATDDTYRVSTNTPFYKQHYKDTGRKPTLGHYRDEARRILSGGTDNSYGVVGPDQVAEFNHALVEQPSTEAYANTPEAIELDTQAKLENEVKELRKQAARKPLSTPVDTTPAIAKRVTQKENAEIAKLRKQIKNEKAQKQKKAAIEAKQRADRVAAKKAKLANKIPDTPKARAKVATNTIPDLFSKYLDHDNKGYNKLENEKGNIPVINKKGSYIESNRKTKDISRKNFKFAEESIAKGLHNMSKSDNKAARSIPRMLQYISKNAGQDPRMVEAASRFAGENTYTDSALLTLGEEAYKLLPDEASRERVHATLDPNSVIADMVKNKNNDYVEQRNAPKYDDLSKNEQKAADMLRDMGEAINDSSYRAGMISQEVWQKNKGGKYIARMYEDIKNSKDVVSEVGISESAAQQLFTGMYKSREKLNDALREKMLRDPVKLAVIRARQVRNNEALSNYVQEADSSGYISDKPKDGWVKVSYDQANNGHMFMNNWGGKFMRRDVYENINGYTSGSQAINHMNNILDLYDGNPARRLRKKLLTVYNPVVRTGNITSNYLFAYLNGVNPATFTANKRWAKSVMDNKKGGSKGSDPLYIEAQRQGLIGNSILRSDRNLFNTDKEWQRDIKNRNVKTKFTDKVRDKVDRFEKRYGEADDLSKLSALKTHVDRGHSVADAIEMTKRGFQDYNRVGHMYDMGAKSPVFGNAFIRFQGDLWTGILKNAAIDHPLRLAALPVATYAMGQALSGIMGEDEEDKETRENRAGAPKIPFTDISTEFQTPFGAFDASRFLGVYNREDLDGNDFTDEISKLLPFNVINPLKLNTAEGKTDAVSKMASDPLIGPLLSVLFDTDYRGKSISDPDGVRNGQELFPDEKLSDKDKWRNRRQYLVEAYMPYPYREGSDIVASSTEKMRNEQSVRGGKNDPSNPDASFLEREGYNNSGSKKTVGQSLARLFGVRLEQYGEDEAKTQRERNEMFSFFDEVDDWKETLDTETRKKFDSRHKSNTSRSGVAEEFADNPFYKYKNAAELRDDNLFNAEKKYAEMQNKKDGKPIDPLFNLPKDQRNMVLWKNSLPPGAKDDAVTAMYDQDWYEQFRNEQGKYFGAKDKYAEKRGFNKFTDTNPYPKPTDELQGVIDGYYDLSSGQRTSWRNKNPGLYQQMKDQFAKQDEWTNTERVALGLAPIEDKYGKYAKSGSGGRGRGKGRGRGRGGRGGGGSNAIAKSLASSYKLQADTLGKLTQLLNSTTKKPTAGMNAGKKVVTKKPNLKKITVNMSSKG